MATLVLSDSDDNKQSNETQDEQKSHQSIRIISCDICGTICENIASLSKHNEKVHQINESSKDTCVCGICGAVFEKQRFLLIHYAMHKNTDTICNKDHTTKSALESHMVVHTKEKKYTDCGKLYARKESLSPHIEKSCAKQKSLEFCQTQVITKTNKIERVNGITKTNVCDIDKQDSQKSQNFQISQISPIEVETDLTRDEQKSHQSLGNTSCDICGTVYKSIASLSKHNKKVHQINNLSSKDTCVCGICGAVFEKRRSLHAHYAMHKNTCTICNKAHANKAALESHNMVVHTGEKKYKCTECGNLFTRKDSLDNHIKKSCTKQKSLKFCLSQVVTQTNTIEAVNGSTNNNVCDIDKQDPQKLPQSHITPTEHETDMTDGSTGTEVCDICGVDFQDEASLITHKATHGYTCTICNKKFIEKSYLKSHMRIHTGEKKHVCEFCGKRFIKNSAYVSHKRRHTGEKPYSCSICSFAFPVRNELTVHMTKHSEERKYKCNICDKAFKTPASLKIHSRSHQEISNFKCDVCGKTFTQSGNLKNHMVVHTGEKNHKCIECGKLFSWKRSLIKHTQVGCTQEHCTKQGLKKSRKSQTLTKEYQSVATSESTDNGIKKSNRSHAVTENYQSVAMSISTDSELSDSCGEDFQDAELSDSCSQDFRDKSSFINQKAHLHDIIEQHYFMSYPSKVVQKSDQIEKKIGTTDINMYVTPKNDSEISSQPQYKPKLLQIPSQNTYESQVVSKAYQIEMKKGFSDTKISEIAEQTLHKSDFVSKSHQVGIVTGCADKSTSDIDKVISQSSFQSVKPIIDQVKITERSVENKSDSAKQESHTSNQSLIIPRIKTEAIIECTDDNEGEKIFICELCGKEFKDFKSVSAHNRTHQKIQSELKSVRQISADIVQKSDSENYKKSNEIQNDLKVYKARCGICGVKYTNMYSLNRHIKKVHKINRKSSRDTHVCRICGAVFDEQRLLHRHNAIHKYTCMICNKSHYSKFALESHMVVHTGEKKYKCTECGNLYARKDSLKKHIKESCAKQMSLKFCQAQVVTKTNEIEMVNGTTNNNVCDIDKQDSQKLPRSQITPTEDETDMTDGSTDTIVCDICGEYFQDDASLIKHKVKHGYTCTICHKKFHEKGTLTTHMRIHTGEKKYVCEFCGKRFAKTSHCVRHKRIHTGEKPYSCDICSFAFSDRSDLTVHMTKHSEERKYKCNFCDKTYKTQAGLKLHTRSHLGINFKCDECGKTFTQSGTLKAHMVVHTGEKNHKCIDCGKLFSWKTALIKHTKERCTKKTL